MAPSRPRVLVLSALPAALLERLGAACEVTVAPAEELTDEVVAERVPGHDGVQSLLTHRLGRRTFEAADRLSIVANCAAGVDNVDLEAARRHGVTVTNTPDVLTDDTADLTWALILAVCRRLVEGDRCVRAGEFSGWKPDLLLGRSLASRTLGVVGAGRIGRAVLARAGAFCRRRLYTSRSRLPAEEERRLGAVYRPLEALLEEADVVSLHVPLSEETRHLIDAPALARLGPDGVVVNTSRGAVVDEAALAGALEAGQLAGAGLDVFEAEPQVDPRLLAHPHTVLTPHVGSATRETRFRMAELNVEDLLTALVHGERPERSLPGA